MIKAIRIYKMPSNRETKEEGIFLTENIFLLASFA